MGHRQQTKLHSYLQNRATLRYCPRATHGYLGKQHLIKATHSKVGSVKLRGAFFHVLTSQTGEPEVERLMTKSVQQPPSGKASALGHHGVKRTDFRTEVVSPKDGGALGQRPTEWRIPI